MDPILEALLQSVDYLTPAIAVSLELEQANSNQPEAILQYTSRIDAAIKQTELEIHDIERVLAILRDSPPVPAVTVPAGF